MRRFLPSFLGLLLLSYAVFATGVVRAVTPVTETVEVQPCHKCCCGVSGVLTVPLPAMCTTPAPTQHVIRTVKLPAPENPPTTPTQCSTKPNADAMGDTPTSSTHCSTKPNAEAVENTPTSSTPDPNKPCPRNAAPLDAQKVQFELTYEEYMKYIAGKQKKPMRWYHLLGGAFMGLFWLFYFVSMDTRYWAPELVPSFFDSETWDPLFEPFYWLWDRYPGFFDQFLGYSDELQEERERRGRARY